MEGLHIGDCRHGEDGSEVDAHGLVLGLDLNLSSISLFARKRMVLACNIHPCDHKLILYILTFLMRIATYTKVTYKVNS